MDPNIDGRLRAIEAKLDDIQKTTNKIRKAQKSAMSARIAYWIFIILLGLGAFYFLKPVMEQLKGVYGSFGGNGDQLEQLFEQFKNDR